MSSRANDRLHVGQRRLRLWMRSCAHSRHMMCQHFLITVSRSRCWHVPHLSSRWEHCFGIQTWEKKKEKKIGKKDSIISLQSMDLKKKPPMDFKWKKKKQQKDKPSWR
jgi:hypothetical protein